MRIVSLGGCIDLTRSLHDFYDKEPFYWRVLIDFVPCFMHEVSTYSTFDIRLRAVEAVGRGLPKSHVPMLMVLNGPPSTAGLTYQKPEREYYEADENVRKHWRRYEIPKIKRCVAKNKAILYF